MQERDVGKGIKDGGVDVRCPMTHGQWWDGGRDPVLPVYSNDELSASGQIV